MPDPYPTIDEAIGHVEEIERYFLDGGNPDNVNTTGYHIENGPAVISSALIGVHEKSLPPGIQKYHKEFPAWVGIAPETKEARAGKLNTKLLEATHKYPLQVPQLANELIKSLYVLRKEELKKTPS